MMMAEGGGGEERETEMGSTGKGSGRPQKRKCDLLASLPLPTPGPVLG